MAAQIKGHGGSAFDFLAGLKFCAVTFVLDYYQFLIGTEGISIYSHPVIQVGGRVLRHGDSGYRDALCERIGSDVVNVFETENELTLRFSDDACVVISFRAQDRIGGGPESLVAQEGMLVVGDSEPSV